MRQYKQTGDIFFPEIPDDWDMIRGRGCFKENKDKNAGLQQRRLLQFCYGNIIRKERQEIHQDEEETIKKYTIVKPGDIIINGLNLNYDFVTQRVGLATEDGAITSAYLSVRCRDIYSPDYAAYVLRMLDARKVFNGMGTGIRMTLGYREFSRMNFPLPPKHEQDRIASYLDAKVSALDRLSELTWRQAGLLAEYRERLILDAVTGADCQERRDVGLSWVKSIPAHWETIRLKYICTFKAGKNLTSADINPDKGAYQVYGGNGIRGYYGKHNVDGPCLVIGRQGALSGNVHRIKEKIWATDHAVITKTNPSLNIDYAYYMLTAMNLNRYAGDKAAQPGIAVSIIKDLRGILPPIDEQKRIADYLDDKTEKISRLNAILLRKTALLKEYRTRLIYDAVTGHIEELSRDAG